MCQLLNSVFWCIYSNLSGSLTIFDCIRMQSCSYSRTYMWVEINKRCLLPWIRFFRRLFRSGTLVMMLGLSIVKLSLCLYQKCYTLTTALCQYQPLRLFSSGTVPMYTYILVALCQCMLLYHSGTAPIPATMGIF